jgi:hypothetical protein
MQWFMSRGYLVSLPVEPGPYDLVVESDAGLQRIQVKTAGTVAPTGNYVAKMTRTVYDVDAPRSRAGCYRAAPYAPGTTDFFFLVAGDGAMYLIPFGAVAGATNVTLSKDYRKFRVG